MVICYVVKYTSSRSVHRLKKIIDKRINNPGGP